MFNYDGRSFAETHTTDFDWPPMTSLTCAYTSSGVSDVMTAERKNTNKISCNEKLSALQSSLRLFRLP